MPGQRGDVEDVRNQQGPLARSNGFEGGVPFRKQHIYQKRIQLYVASSLLAVAVAVAVLALPRISATVLDTRQLSLAGVPLVGGNALHYDLRKEAQVLPELAARLGKPSIFRSSICTHLPVTVAEWHDLAVFFDNGKFAGLSYNSGGWAESTFESSGNPTSAPKLTPLVQTEHGVTVGSVFARTDTVIRNTLSPGDSGFNHDGFTTIVTSPLMGAPGYVVTGIFVAMGNC
ncbi:MAG: hypothetical protein ACHQFZ_03900 [Acidimicrobiales bacterium]